MAKRETIVRIFDRSGLIATSDPVTDKTSDQIWDDMDEFYPVYKKIREDYALASGAELIWGGMPIYIDQSSRPIWSRNIYFEDEFKKAYGYTPILTAHET